MKLDSAGFLERVKEALKTDSVPEIAKLLGLSKNAVYLWQKGGFPELEKIARISQLSQTSLDWLLTGKGKKFTEESRKTLESQSGVRYKDAITNENFVTLELEQHIENQLQELAAAESESVEEMAARLVIEAMIARGIITDKVESLQLQFFGDAAINLVEIPLLGTIAAGEPIRVFENPETVLVAEEFVFKHRKTYALRVQGDSMIEDGILDGDLIIVVQNSTANPGQMVVAIIDRDQATVKRYFRRGNQVVLRPANPRYKDIVLPPDRVEIRGVVIGIQRRT